MRFQCSDLSGLECLINKVSFSSMENLGFFIVATSSVNKIT